MDDRAQSDIQRLGVREARNKDHEGTDRRAHKPRSGAEKS